MASGRGFRPSPMPSDTEKMGGPASNTAVPLERMMSRDPVRSLQSMALHPKKEDAACGTNPNQTSSAEPRQVEGVWAPGVSHPSDTAPTADPNL